jgi:hypothetical protein
LLQPQFLLICFPWIWLGTKSADITEETETKIIMKVPGSNLDNSDWEFWFPSL